MQLEIKEVLGVYKYIGMININEAPIYGQVAGYTGPMQGIIFKDWDDDGIWKGVVRYFVVFIIEIRLKKKLLFEENNI